MPIATKADYQTPTLGDYIRAKRPKPAAMPKPVDTVCVTTLHSKR